MASLLYPLAAGDLQEAGTIQRYVVNNSNYVGLDDGRVEGLSPSL